MLSSRLWSRLGADPALVGTDVRLNGRPYTVIGVMPSEFTFLRNDAVGQPQRVDAFTTFEVVLAETNPDTPAYSGLIRARPGASPQGVEAAVSAVGRIVDANHFGGRGLTLPAVLQNRKGLPLTATGQGDIDPLALIEGVEFGWRSGE